MTYLIYLLEASLILAGFYFFYHWLIRPLTFYAYKRILLLCIPLLALGMPLLQFELDWQAPITQLDWIPAESPAPENSTLPAENTTLELNQEQAPPSQEAITWHWSQWLLVIYFIGAVLALFFFIYKLVKVFQMHRKASHWQQNIYLSQLAKPAYSFAGRIYLHSNLPATFEFRQILQHEQVHVKQWHTLDLILFELQAIVFWFNPASWWLARESRLNNEMLADQVSVATGSKTDYAQLLLKYAASNSSRQLYYSFARLQVKSRIEGVLSDESKRSSKIRFALMAPIILLCLFIFSCSQELIYPEKLSYFNGKKIKRIEATYIDEYGDQHHKNGKLIKYVDFQRNGKVKDYESTESTHGVPELTDLAVAIGFIENSPFDPKLTHGFLLEGYDYVKTYANLFDNNKPLFKPKPPLGYFDGKKSRASSVKWEQDLPVELNEAYEMEIIKNIKVEKNRRGYETIHTGEFAKRKRLEKFEYDHENLTIKHLQAHFKNEKPFFYMEYEGDNSVTEEIDKTPDEPLFDYFERQTYQFDEQKRLIAIYRNDGSLLKEIEYLNDKLINLYRVYNLKEELEYTVQINYEFY